MFRRHLCLGLLVALLSIVASAHEVAAQTAREWQVRMSNANKAEQWDEVISCAERMLIAASASDRAFYRDKAFLGYVLALNGMEDAKRYDDVKRHGRRALELCELSGRESKYVTILAPILGRVYSKLKDHEESARMFRWALSTWEFDKHPEDETIARVWYNLGDEYADLKRLSDADDCFKKSLRILEALQYPAKDNVFGTLWLIGYHYQQQKQYPQAENAYLHAMDVALKYPQEPKWELIIDNFTDVENIYRATDRKKEIETLYKSALKKLEQTVQGEDLRHVRCLYRLANWYDDENRPADAEPLLLRALAIAERIGKVEHRTGMWARTLLTTVYLKLRRDDKIEALYLATIASRERNVGKNDNVVRILADELSQWYQNQGRNADAERWSERSRGILEDTLREKEQKLGPNHAEVAVATRSLAKWHRDRFHAAEAEAMYRRAAEIFERAGDAHRRELANTWQYLATFLRDEARYQPSNELYAKARAVYEAIGGPEDEDLIWCLKNESWGLCDQGRYGEAEALARRSLDIAEKKHGPVHDAVVGALTSLSHALSSQGRYAENEAVCRRCLAINEKLYGADNKDIAISQHNLARALERQGRYAEAEMLYKQTLATEERLLSPYSPSLANSFNSLAGLYDTQGRKGEAEKLYIRVLKIYQHCYQPNHPLIARTMNNLAGVYRSQGKYAEAAQHTRQALAIYENTPNIRPTQIAWCVSSLGWTLLNEKKYDEAEAMFRRSLKVYEDSGAAELDVTYGLYNLANCLFRREKYAEAEPLIDQVILVRDRAATSAESRYYGYYLRARIAWELGRQRDAVADLNHALDLAEQQRLHAGGAEQERATTFATFSDAFEHMVSWQSKLEDPAEVLHAIERGRARSLLDELSLGGSDLNLGRSAIEREQLQQRERELNQQITDLEAELAKLPTDGGTPSTQRQSLDEKLSAARTALYEHYRNQRSSNPVYRNLLAVGSGPPRLSQVQRRLSASEATMLVYFVGGEKSVVVAIDADRSTVHELSANDEQAKTLGIDAGALTSARLQATLADDQRTGVLQQLNDAERATDATDRLAALWQVLIPEEVRERLAARSIKRLIVVPDGPLAVLPFETLVLKPGNRPEYLLDVGSAITYVPSLSVWYNLADRPARRTAAAGEPLLTVADVAYDLPSDSSPVPPLTAVAAVTSRSTYASLGGHLSPLPHTLDESRWLVDVFGQQGMTAKVLNRRQATEAEVRKQVAGRKIVHFACHGLADQSFGNFFGALALTPGLQGTKDPSDDGMLRLAEIYELNLTGCDLAILSACQTNFGPQQKGEGVWALSRGFLVAGTRRVVASNWLVDDEATATLVSGFGAEIARASKEDKSVDYARCLQQAKRFVRNHDKWSSPYYWAPMVLVGPH